MYQGYRLEDAALLPPSLEPLKVSASRLELIGQCWPVR